ncbi:AAA family ATPase [Deinococcus sp. KNUC1210]|uniref:AAA family ATPase n=1 Tax=Deinococcus sp. KNUC1210 TaxID=2917691 RepID=UPI001EF0F71B|nr:AAA family ATPase [Deinococcus sp. KNUC1210]ULH15508.1 AAA family ATPase [Deinococcus sp. KNUC1210]
MSTPDRIHILGASGAGTTTLGRLLAEQYGHVPLDTDDFFWEPTVPPYEVPRSRAERLALLAHALARHQRWVLSGSLCGWGDVMIPQFDLVVFLSVPPALRMQRLEHRERQRFGPAIQENGDLFGKHREFMDWASKYDGADQSQRSRAAHEVWMQQVSCPVLRLVNDGSVQRLLQAFIDLQPL